MAANGERIPNRGEVELSMKSGDAQIKSVFQVSRISRPLWSVGKLCDAGYSVTFERGHADIKQASTGKSVGKFERKQGLYVGTFQLKNPKHTASTASSNTPTLAPAAKQGTTPFQRQA